MVFIEKQWTDEGTKSVTLVASSVLAGSAWASVLGRLVGCQGGKGWTVVRGKLGPYQLRRITRDNSKWVRVPGKPEQGPD